MTAAPPRPWIVRTARPPAVTFRLSETVAALSAALDLTEGQPAGHAVRSCLIGMKLAEAIGLSDADRSALFYALLLKDLGCSSNASKMCYLLGSDDREAKCDVKTVNNDDLRERVHYLLRRVCPTGSITRRIGKFIRLGIFGPREAKALIRTRCERGGAIASLFGLPEATSRAIRSLDEHWDGRGHPDGLRGQDIPMLGRILGLAQTVEVFLMRDGLDAAMDVAQMRSGGWFDPLLVDTLHALRHDQPFWVSVTGSDPMRHLGRYEPADRVMLADEATIDRLCFGFAQVVDAKSPWTRRHSEGVAQLAMGIGTELGLGLDELRDLRRVGLMHDLGKLGVSNMILDKPGRLDDDERAVMCRHPGYSREILGRVPCLSGLCDLAASHHERLDGKGYYRGLSGDELSSSARALVVADMFEAMSATRPYRETMPRERVLGILKGDAGTAVCPEAVAALERFLDRHGYDPAPLTAA